MKRSFPLTQLFTQRHVVSDTENRRNLVTTCLSCSRTVADDLLACPSCGAVLVGSATPTRMPQSGDNAEQQAALVRSEVSTSTVTLKGKPMFAISGYGFYTSLGGQKLLAGRLLDG